LTRCEFAFYWNVFSFSTLLRLIRRQPVFFFDKGHLSRLLTPFYDVAIDSYFEGHEPVALNADEALTPARVSALARDSSEFAARVSTALERQPSPAEVIETLLSARRTTTSAATSRARSS
jgi:hypothetical protein